MRTINYYFGKEDEEDLFELEITPAMLRDSVRDMLVQLSQAELIDFVVDNIPDDMLFDIFEYDLKEEYEILAYEIYKENKL